MNPETQSPLSNPSETLPPVRKSLFYHDVLLIVIMAVLAACGLVYEYLISHYATRILGAVETTIYSIIGIMIVSMGVGSFAAKGIKDEFRGFVWLEVSVAFLGSLAILGMSGLVAFFFLLPQTLASLYGVSIDLFTHGWLFVRMQGWVENAPYLMGALMGFLIGMEIPLIARVRESLYQRHLINNTGTIYGADYIGAGVGAAIWVLFMLKMEVSLAAAATASLNLVAGSIFIIVYRKRIKKWYLPALAHLLMVPLILGIFYKGPQMMNWMNDTLYLDHVIYQTKTPYQNVVVTKRNISPALPPIYSLYLNGRLQFASNDEHIYHSMLVYPPMLASAHHDNVLIIGGGDGLALRNVLRWNPKEVTLIDLDKSLVNLFRGKEVKPEDNALSKVLRKLNHDSFNDPRVHLIFGDAYLRINTLINQKRQFDTIIIDLPDPNHPDLDKLYSDQFYSRLKLLLNGGGALVVQSTSPYHAKKAFISIGKTLAAAGYPYVEQYHQNVPSFGEWGWSIATIYGEPASHRIEKIKKLPIDDEWVTADVLKAAFVFQKDFYRNSSSIKVNKTGSNILYHYHSEAWKRDGEAMFVGNLSSKETK
jgi:spermidine synthase